MVEFDIVAYDLDEASIREQLARKLHPSIRVQIKMNRATRWIQANLDSFQIVNGCIKFNGILSRTFYFNYTTFYQESELIGWYSLDHRLGGLTIF